MGKKVTWSQLPVSLPEGVLSPHMSAKLRTQIIDSVFDRVGGEDRLAAFVERNDENYLEFLKLWGRGAARPQHLEVSSDGSIENLLDQLDERKRAESARVVNGEVVEAEIIDGER